MSAAWGGDTERESGPGLRPPPPRQQQGQQGRKESGGGVQPVRLLAMSSTWINPNGQLGRTREERRETASPPSNCQRTLPSSRPTPAADPLWACQGLALGPLSLGHYRMVSSQIESSDPCVSDLSAVRPAAELRALEGPPGYPYSASPQLGGRRRRRRAGRRRANPARRAGSSQRGAWAGRRWMDGLWKHAVVVIARRG